MTWSDQVGKKWKQTVAKMAKLVLSLSFFSNQILPDWMKYVLHANIPLATHERISYIIFVASECSFSFGMLAQMTQSAKNGPDSIFFLLEMHFRSTIKSGRNILPEKIRRANRESGTDHGFVARSSFNECPWAASLSGIFCCCLRQPISIC